MNRIEALKKGCAVTVLESTGIKQTQNPSLSGTHILHGQNKRYPERNPPFTPVPFEFTFEYH